MTNKCIYSCFLSLFIRRLSLNHLPRLYSETPPSSTPPSSSTYWLRQLLHPPGVITSAPYFHEHPSVPCSDAFLADPEHQFLGVDSSDPNHGAQRLDQHWPGGRGGWCRRAWFGSGKAEWWTNSAIPRVWSGAEEKARRGVWVRHCLSGCGEWQRWESNTCLQTILCFKLNALNISDVLVCETLVFHHDWTDITQL